MQTFRAFRKATQACASHGCSPLSPTSPGYFRGRRLLVDGIKGLANVQFCQEHGYPPVMCCTTDFVKYKDEFYALPMASAPLKSRWCLHVVRHTVGDQWREGLKEHGAQGNWTCVPQSAGALFFASKIVTPRSIASGIFATYSMSLRM